MNVSTIISTIVIMATMIVIGCLLTRSTPFTTERRQLLMNIIINVAMPCMILNGVFQTEIDSQFLLILLLTFVISIIINYFGVFEGWVVARTFHVSKTKTNEIALLSGIGNTGFIGIPLCAELFGPKGALLAAVFDAGIDFTIWSIGVMMLQNKSFQPQALKSLLNIPMLSIFAGMMFAALNVSPPPFVQELTESFANLATPLAMMYIGMLIPSVMTKKLPGMKQISIPLVLKLFIFPLAIATILSFIPLPNELKQVIVVQTTMPCMTMASILFSLYSCDEEYGASMTVLSVILSITTTPAMIMLGLYILK
ncbi:AEC family transporter [Ammoniphilus sp. 3BR4]|uniref:AEC family transporter n=1 Tax=Ammoniphilus sp. 3BR4 TaxID=3158265 RepID=UPI0034676C09